MYKDGRREQCTFIMLVENIGLNRFTLGVERFFSPNSRFSIVDNLSELYIPDLYLVLL